MSFFDFESKSQLILGLERRSKCGKFVNKTAERPDITLFIIFLFVDLLRAHVVGCAYVRLRVHWTLVHYTCKSEVPKLRILGSVQKDVTWLQVSVQNPLRAFLLNGILGLRLLSTVNGGGLGTSMAKVESRDNLCEDFPNKVLLNLLFILYAALYNLLQIAAFTVLHNDVDFKIALINAAVVKANDVRVL